MRSARIAIVSALVSTHCAAQHADALCASEPATRLSVEHRLCRGRLVPFLSNGMVRQIELASVTVGFKRNLDVISDVQNYLLRLPGGEIAQFDFVPSFPKVVLDQPYFQSFRVSDELLHDVTAFEISSGTFCAVRKLKYPFVGAKKNCGPEQREDIHARLTDGLLTPADARNRVCRLMVAELGHCIALRSIELEQSDRGDFFYSGAARVRLGKKEAIEDSGEATEVLDYEERTYHVSMDGAVSLKEKYLERCSHRKLERPNKALQPTCETHAAER